LYRYKLGGNIDGRGWGDPGTTPMPILWIMHNPSTANATEDDATIQTITIFSELWRDFGRLMVGNLYAYRTKHPKVMRLAWRQGIDIVGPQNDAWLAKMAREVRDAGGKIVAAWGAGASGPREFREAHRSRWRAVAELLGDLHCLKITQDGSPVHPLYQSHRLTPQIWTARHP